MEQEVQKLDFEYQVTADIFTDIIEVRISDDTVCLGLGIKSEDKKTAVIKTRVFMTISHFNRFIAVGNGLLNQIKKEIAKNQTKKDSPT